MTYTDLIKAVSTDANCSQTLVKQIIETLSNHVAREVLMPVMPCHVEGCE